MFDSSRDPISDRHKPSRGSGKMFPWMLALPVVVVLVLVGMGVVSEIWQEGGRPSGEAGIAVGQTAPAIVASGWINGEAPPAGDLAGRVVVVSAWATWCGPCRREAPHLVALYRKYSDRGVVFIGLTSESEDSLNEIEGFVNRYDIEWPNGYGAAETLMAYGAEAIPAEWVIGADGKIAWNFDGPGTLEEGIIKALAAQKAGSR